MAIQPTIPATSLPANVKALYDKAVQAVRLNNSDYAIQILQAILKDQPDFLEGRQICRNAAVKRKASAGKKFLDTSSIALMKISPKVKKDSLGAIVELELILADDPHNVQANQLLFEAADAIHMVDTAAFALETIRQGHPKQRKSHHKLAEYYMVHDMPDRAAKVYESLVNSDAADGEARKGYTNANARLSMKQQKWDSSGSGVKVLSKDAKENKILELLSKQALTPEQGEELLAYLNSEYEKDQTKLITVRHLAETYEKLDRIEEAYSFFDYAWRLSDGDSAYEKKVQKLADRISEIHLRNLEAWLRDYPDHPDALTQQEALKELKKERALRLLTQSKEQVDRNPTDPQLRFEYGVQLHAVGKPAEAIPELQKAKSNPGIRSKAMLMLAQCFQARGMADMAARQLEELTKEIQTMDATKTEAVYLLGHMYMAMGKKEDAFGQWKQIYEIDSGYKDVTQLVESSYEA